MDSQEKIKIISQTIKSWADERDFFIAALRCAVNPEQLEAIITGWQERRQKAADRFNKTIQEVI